LGAPEKEKNPGVLGTCPVCPLVKTALGAGGRAPAVGLGAKPPRSWSINAFCVMVKPFS